MKKYFSEISGQSFKAYLWPDISTPLGEKTAIYEGAMSSLGLAVIYGLYSLNLFLFGAETPAELQELTDSDLIPDGLYSSLKLLLGLVACFTALYYVRSVGKKKSTSAIVFLFIWLVLEIFDKYSEGSVVVLVIYLTLFLGVLNAYRAVRS